MLPAELRMHRTREFDGTFRGGVRAGRRTVVVYCRAVPERRGSQVGFVVGRGVGRAVTRNRVRRRLRGVVLEGRGLLGEGFDVVIRALPGAADVEYLQLAADVTSALQAACARAGSKGSRSINRAVDQ